MLSSLARGCAEANESMCTSSPQVDIQAIYAVTNERKPGPEVRTPLGKAGICLSITQSELLLSIQRRYPFLCHRNIAYLKVRIGTRIKENTAGVAFKSMWHFVTAPKAQFTQDNFFGTLQPAHPQSAREDRLPSLLTPGPTWKSHGDP